MEKRSQYWQMVRGLCILAVIMIHCPTGQNYSNYEYVGWVVLRQFINFPVAVFIFLAGYFTKPEKTQGNYSNYLVKRGGERLLLPYLTWSCIYLIKDAIFGQGTIKHAIYALLCGKAVAPFYYIIVMLQLTVITPWLVKHRRGWMYLITPVYLVAIYIYNIVCGTTPLFYETLFPAWFFFYIFGMDCRNGKWDRLISKISFSWIFWGLGFSFVETAVLKSFGCVDGFIVSQIRFCSFLFATVVILLLLKKEKNMKKNIITIIGDCSYGIFYSHMLIMWIVRKGIEIVGLNNNWLVFFGLCFIFTALGSLAFVKIVQIIAQKIKCKKILAVIGF